MSEVFGGLIFRYQRKNQWGTYWQRGELGMVLLPSGRYQCHTLETDVEGNPWQIWEGEDPHVLVGQARAFYQEFSKKWEHTFLPDGP